MNTEDFLFEVKSGIVAQNNNESIFSIKISL